MVGNPLNRVKFRRTSDRITSNISLLGIHGLAQRFGLLSFFDETFPSSASNRAFKDFKYPYLQVLTRAAGGVGISDTRIVSEDLPLCRCLFPQERKAYREGDRTRRDHFPAPSTMSEYYDDLEFMIAHRTRRMNREICGRLLEAEGVSSLHADIDSKVHASNNKQARMTYKGYTGYNPMYVTLPDQKLLLDALFRPGNTSPQSHNGSLVREILRFSERVQSLEELILTVDNAGCHLEVLKEARRANQKREMDVHLYTRPCKPEEGREVQDKVMRWIAKTETTLGWTPVKIKREEGRKRYRYKGQKETNNQKEEPPSTPGILDTYYPLGDTDGGEAVVGRLVVLRKPIREETPQKTLLEGYEYIPVLTNDMDRDATEVLETYNRRGAGEDLIGEAVGDGEAERFPCRSDEGNAAYLILSALALNLLREWKRIGEEQQAEMIEEQTSESGDEDSNQKDSPQSSHETQGENQKSFMTSVDWFSLTLSRLGALIFRQPVKITKGGRYRHIQIPEDAVYGDLLERIIKACFSEVPRTQKQPAPT